MQHLLRNLELYLSALGLGVVYLTAVILEPLGFDPWVVGAITAAVVGVIHGVIFWMVRRRQQEVRLETIHDIQSMLNDLINNQLTVIKTMNTLKTPGIDEQRQREYVTASIDKISAALDNLSEESLLRWKTRYGRRD